MPGCGLVSSTGNTTDGMGFIADASTLPNDTAAVTPVLECPIGFYGAGMSIRATCVKCPEGSTTEESARTAPEQCSSKQGDSREAGLHGHCSYMCMRVVHIGLQGYVREE